jgi:hypothetical protein
MNSPIRIAIGRLQYKCAAVGSTQAGEDGEAHIIHISKSFLVENGAVEDASGVGGGRHDDEDCWVFACCNTIIYLLFAKALHSVIDHLSHHHRRRRPWFCFGCLS